MSFEARAARLDAEDELRSFRERFVIDDANLIYLDGNSLGRLPKRSAERVRELLDREWGGRLVRAWGDGWMEAPRRIGDRIAKLIGARPGEVVVCDSTSVNLFKLTMAALATRPDRPHVVTEARSFPSDVHVLDGAARLAGRKLVVAATGDGVEPDLDALASAIDERTALLSLCHVEYVSGYAYDLARWTRAAHDVGALALFDLCHSVGALPIDLGAAGVDLAVGCTYKYVNGGPGAPAFLYVRRALQEQLRSPIQGWLGGAQPFEFGLDFVAAPDVSRFLAGTPSMLSLAPIEPALELLLEAGVGRLREKSITQTELLIELHDAVLAPLGFTLRSPRAAARRGSHIALAHPEAWRIDQALITEADVIPDFRPPDVLRLGVAPLYTSFTELVEAVRRMERVVTERVYEKYPVRRGGVT